jgi:dUTP pyrophosphatase
LAIELPIGYHCELFPRSSITKMDLMLKNSIGLIDNEYRGELIFRFHQFPMVNGTNSVYKKGDRIGQIVLRKTIHMPIMVVDELSDTSRGTGGFGSSTGEFHIVAGATNVGKSCFKSEEVNPIYKSIGVDTRMI